MLCVKKKKKTVDNKKKEKGKEYYLFPEKFLIVHLIISPKAWIKHII